MTVMCATRPAEAETELYQCRVRLAAELTAPGEARTRVREAICAWHVPVDPDIAMLLTSDLVTNAIRQEAGEKVTLAIRCSLDRLRVEVHGSSCPVPGLAEAPADAAAGGGLALVGILSTDWGSYRTPAGKAMYFSLAFSPYLAVGDGRDPQG